MNLFLMVITLLGCGATSTSEALDQTTAAATRSDIDVAELKRRMSADKVVLIDVRTVEEFASGHAPTAKNVPLASFDPAAYESGPLHVICASGGRSSRATDSLVAAGIDAVNIKGGTRAWRAAGYEVE